METAHVVQHPTTRNEANSVYSTGIHVATSILMSLDLSVLHVKICSPDKCVKSVKRASRSVYMSW